VDKPFSGCTFHQFLSFCLLFFLKYEKIMMYAEESNGGKRRFFSALKRGKAVHPLFIPDYPKLFSGEKSRRRLAFPGYPHFPGF